MDDDRQTAAPEPAPASRRWLNRTVAGAGMTSALGDFCYETTTVILPGFLAVLGIPAAALGIIEGAADAVASFTRMASGYIADRLGHRKGLVLAGYALTPLGQILIALATGWPLLLIGRLVSWFGKGLRGPLRDAIVIQAVSADTRGRAFGFHRAMDTIGAVIGPLLGVAVLEWARTIHRGDAAGPFRFVLWLSIVPGVLAVFAFLAMVDDPERSPNPGRRFLGALRELPVRFKRYLGAVGVFGLGDFSHSLLILAATQLLAPSLGVVRAAQTAGLLYVGRNVVQVLASYPVGAWADKVGSSRLLVVGYLIGAVTAALIGAMWWLGLADMTLLGVVFLLAGLYVAVQDTLESTVTADMVPSDALAISYGALGTVNGCTRFLSSGMVGVLWTAVSPAAGFGAAAVLMFAGVIALRRSIGR
ncbi:MFS transporter [Burkholderia stagnalis]